MTNQTHPCGICHGNVYFYYTNSQPIKVKVTKAQVVQYCKVFKEKIPSLRYKHRHTLAKWKRVNYLKDQDMIEVEVFASSGYFSSVHDLAKECFEKVDAYEVCPIPGKVWIYKIYLHNTAYRLLPRRQRMIYDIIHDV